MLTRDTTDHHKSWFIFGSRLDLEQPAIQPEPMCVDEIEAVLLPVCTTFGVVEFEVLSTVGRVIMV